MLHPPGPAFPVSPESAPPSLSGVAVPAGPGEAHGDLPLCVVAEGTLFRVNALHEALLRALRHSPLRVFGWLIDALRRPQAAWTRAWRDVGDSFERLPHDPRVLEWIQTARASGRRRVVLCIDAPMEDAQRLLARFPVFDEALTFDRTEDRSPEGRRSRLARDFGAEGFDLLASPRRDAVALQAARCPFVAGEMSGEDGSLRRAGAVLAVPERRLRARAWLRALRLRQWAKNLLLFVPAAAAHSIVEPLAVLQCLAAFLFFGLCASGTYFVNDLLDIDADRQHVRKRARPFAAGDLPASSGMLAAPLLIVVALLGSWLVLSLWFVGCLAVYLVVTLWYSLALKSRAMVDVLVLAGLYTLRVLAGAAAVGTAPSFWLLAFSMFLFFSLAMVKRYTELRARQLAGEGHAPGRGYTTDDLPLLLVFGGGGGLLAVLVLALYIDLGAPAIYAAPHFLWMTCPLLLYWIGRVWMKAHRGTMHDDPVVFALTDRPSLGVASLFGSCVWLATRRGLPDWLPALPA